MTLDHLKNLPEPRKTYLEILQVHDKEVPIANLLAFFFRNKENHELGDLFIKALLQTKYYELDVKNNPTSSGTLISQIGSIEEQTNILNSISNVKVKTEVKTSKDKDDNKRIDILIDTAKFIICIEFKINHTLNNPLETYQNHIVKTYKDFNKKIFYVVLTPNKKEADVSNIKNYLEKNKIFKQVVISHFIKNIQNTLPSNFKENKSSFYFNDFIQTIQNREIRSTRTLLLKKVNDVLICSKIESKYYSNNSGGFLQIKSKNQTLKIRIKDTLFHLENWTSKKEILERLDINTDLNIIAEKIKIHVG